MADEIGASASALADSKKSEGECINVCNCNCNKFNFCFCLLILMLFVCNYKALMLLMQICRPNTASPRTARDRRVNAIIFNLYINFYLRLLLKLFVSCNVCTKFNFSPIYNCKSQSSVLAKIERGTQKRHWRIPQPVPKRRWA